MASMGIQMLGSALCLLGWVGVIISCVMPMWRVTAFVGSTIVTSQTMWEGIWMSCVVQSTGQIQCKPYDSLLALTSDLQAARALMVMSAVVGGAGLLLAFVGGKCTRFMDKEGDGGGRSKGRVAVAAGVVLIATGVLCLIPTSWTAGSVVRKFYSAAVDSQRREIGACLYIGWGSSILLILGGGLFISSARSGHRGGADKSPSVRYLVVRSSNGSGGSRYTGPPSVRSHPSGRALPRSQSYDGASTKSRPPLYVMPPTLEEPDARSGSELSGSIVAPSTKSQMKRPGSMKSEAPSQAPSTKSQLKRLQSQESLVESEANEDDSSNPARTYI